MRARHAAPVARRPGEGLVRAGALVFAVGIAGVLAVLVPFLFGRADAPLWTTLLALALPVGLGMSLVGLLREARARRTAAQRRTPRNV